MEDEMEDEMVFNKSTLEQTAIDYDIELHEVERIATLFPNDFYQKLEEYIL